MDGKTFDSLLQLSATRSGRRRLLQAAAFAGIGGLLTRGGAIAQDVVIEACQDLGTECTRDRQCQCFATGAIDRKCGQLPRQCSSGVHCCGTKKSLCTTDCDCCRGLRCDTVQGTCRRRRD